MKSEEDKITWTENRIHELAEEIREKIKGEKYHMVTTLFGQRIDMSNTDQVLATAYEMGKNEEIKRNLENWEIFNKL